MEKIDPNQAKRVWSRVLAQTEEEGAKAKCTSQPVCAKPQPHFASRLLDALTEQKQDLALYRYLMRKCCSPAMGMLKTLMEHTECRILTLGAIYYLETGKKACAKQEKEVCIACVNEALREQYLRLAAQADAYRALAEQLPEYACEMEQLAGVLVCDKKLILQILKENL